MLSETSETVLILAGGFVALALLYGLRLAVRTAMDRAVSSRPDAGDASATDGSGAHDVPGVIAPPPLMFLGFLVAATVLEAIVPLPVAGAYALVRCLVGAALAECGFVIAAMGMRRFSAAGTNVPPTLPTTALVVDGIYGRTRNPLYLGTTLIYPGLSVAAGTPWAGALSVPLPWGCTDRPCNPLTPAYDRNY